MKQLKGYVEEIDPKLGKNGQMWLLKFKFIDSNEGPVWMGAYADRKDAPKAFVQRVMAEAELPEGDRTIWEITANTVEEKGYENLYVTSARSSTNGHAPAAAAADTPVFAAATRAAFPSEHDAVIIAEVAIKEATSIAGVLMNANPKTFGQEHGSGNHVQVTGFTDAGLVDTVRGFTLEFAQIIVDTARALREVPAAKEEPAKEDSLFDEEPL